MLSSSRHVASPIFDLSEERWDGATRTLTGVSTVVAGEDYELRLREMQLFVVPVTTKLLTKANRAMDVDIPFAFEHHILFCR